MLVKIGQRFPADRAYISHSFPPSVGPLIATGLRHSAGGFVVSCDGGKINVEQMPTIIACHLSDYTTRFSRGQCE
jgi:hypothetical protein